ncbi:hypothetical protein [Nocardia nova]|uniref:hypothetical protein n=1 Tax=Nocardia nova TaxID=37330 RepID=UPI001894649C|nr:hypothetical protein [Nocardia nova]MBF6277013.1 hypothetical protein [Nocardia nova]
MSDREQIRAEVIAVAAQEIARWESDPSPNSRHFACGEGIADALAAAGLLPAGEIWGLLAPDNPFPEVVTTLDDEAEARRYLNDAPGRKLMRRYRHDWTEVTE